MKAIVCTKYGPPEVLQLRDVPKPAPKENEMLVKVHASAVTVSDCRMRGLAMPPVFAFILRLALGFKRPRRSILGFVFAGEVEEVGKDVTRFRKGDPLYGLTGMRLGSYAEYVCVREAEAATRCVGLKPAMISYEQAAAVPYGALLASHFMSEGSIRGGDKVLIYGASGAIGTTAIQLAKHAGAEVTAICSTANLELVRSLGADKTIDYTKENSFSGGERYDFILDAAGKHKTSPLKLQCRNALAPNGKYVSVDDHIARSRPEYLARLTKLIEAGHFQPVIDRCYPLGQTAEAHRYVDQGHKKGNVVISVVKKSA